MTDVDGFKRKLQEAIEYSHVDCYKAQYDVVENRCGNEAKSACVFAWIGFRDGTGCDLLEVFPKASMWMKNQD